MSTRGLFKVIKGTKPSSEYVDEVDEYKCQSCGQVPICLNSTGNGHEVCDDCVSLFKVDTNTVCPLLTCKLPSHMANKIKVLKEDLEKSKCSNKNAIKEVKEQMMLLKLNVNKLSVDNSGVLLSVDTIKTEVSKEMQELKIEVLREMQMDRKTVTELKLKVENLMAQVNCLETESKQLEEKMNDRSKDYEILKLDSLKVLAENSDLKENLSKVKNELTEFQSSVELNTKQMMEKMFLMDTSPPQSQLIPMNGFNFIDQYHQFQPVFTWKIKSIKEKMERKMYEELSDPFLWIGYPVKATAKLELKDEYVHLSMWLKSTNGKAVKLSPTIYYLLKNQSGKESGGQHHRIRAASYDFPSKFNVEKTFNKLLAHKSWFTHESYSVDNAATIEIYVEPPEMAQQVYSRVGVLNWVIKDCEKRQLVEAENLISFQDSPYFYTAVDGYRVRVQLRLNGLEGHKGKGPSACISFLQGKYDDDDLAKSFPHRITITLLNPKDLKGGVVKSLDKDINEKSWYILDICEANELVDLIKDDTLFVRVTIVKAIQ